MMLLKTKLYAPQYPQNFVARQRLLNLLSQGISHKLTLISAPAGYGKTTLLSTWLHESKIPFCWNSLEEQDNDLERFFSYLIAGLHTTHAAIEEEILALLQTHQPDSLTTFLTALINQISLTDKKSVCVLDDYHLIHHQQIHDAVDYLLEHLPPNMHLFIASRADPPLRLSQLRASGELCEIRARDLRFTLEEADDFFNQRLLT